MNLIDRFRNFFRGESPPAPRPLRNKAGRMAWIKGLNSIDGDEVLNGRAVKCVRIETGDFWEIDPPQEYVCTQNTIYADIGVIAWRGDVIRVKAIKDECLEPWRNAPDDAADESAAWLPPVPQTRSTPEKVPA